MPPPLTPFQPPQGIGLAVPCVVSGVSDPLSSRTSATILRVTSCSRKVANDEFHDIMSNFVSEDGKTQWEDLKKYS